VLSKETLGVCTIWGSHSGGYEEFCVLKYNAVQSVESQRMFRKNTLPPTSGPKARNQLEAGSKQSPEEFFWNITPCSPLKVNRRFEGISRLHAALLATYFMPASCLAHYSILKTEATCYSETSVDFRRTIRSYIPENRALRCQLFWELYGTRKCIVWAKCEYFNFKAGGI
jgi:hypothetical protein